MCRVSATWCPAHQACASGAPAACNLSHAAAHAYLHVTCASCAQPFVQQAPCIPYVHVFTCVLQTSSIQQTLFQCSYVHLFLCFIYMAHRRTRRCCSKCVAPMLLMRNIILQTYQKVVFTKLISIQQTLVLSLSVHLLHLSICLTCFTLSHIFHTTDVPEGGVHQAGHHGGCGQQHDCAHPVPRLCRQQAHLLLAQLPGRRGAGGWVVWLGVSYFTFLCDGLKGVGGRAGGEVRAGCGS